jgi:tetratricopeptide (TPR) repeat protein
MDTFLELLTIAGALLILRRQLAALETGSTTSLSTRKAGPQLAHMATYADRLFGERKWLAAEKAYLGVLKLDHKNVTAYSHLGIIYSTQKNLPDAIECFQIAARLHPSGTTFQNLGLAYYENRNYIKSIAAFEKAIMFEPTAQRYVGLSKSHHKLKNIVQSLAALEKAAALEPTKRILQILATAYEDAGKPTEARETYRRIHALDPSDAAAARKIGIAAPPPPPAGTTPQRMLR